MPYVIPEVPTTEQKVKVTAAPTTLAGHPATIDGALVVVVMSGSGTFTQDAAEPLSFFAVTDATDVSDTVYQVSADADLGAGVVTITDTVTMHTQHALAAGFGFTSTPPETK